MAAINMLSIDPGSYDSAFAVGSSWLRNGNIDIDCGPAQPTAAVAKWEGVRLPDWWNLNRCFPAR
jgi:hypothetical protein